MSGRRDIRVDTMRGIACVLLVIYHVIGPEPDDGLRILDGEPMRQFNDALAYIRMPMFAFLSGYVYAWRPVEGELARFIAGKGRRLLIPMVLAGTFFALLRAFTPGVNDPSQHWLTLHIVPVAHFWFLEALFLIFMLVALLEKLDLLSSPKSFAVVWLAALALHVWNPLPVYFGLLGAVYLLPYFLVGVWSNRFAGRYTDSGAIVAALLVAGASIAFLIWKHEFPPRNSILALALGVSACIVLERLRARSSALAWIGVHSFAIYMFHPIFSAASRITLDHLAQFPELVLLAVGLLAGIFGPIVVETGLRKLPIVGAWVLGESVGRKRAPPVPRVPTVF